MQWVSVYIILAHFCMEYQWRARQWPCPHPTPGICSRAVVYYPFRAIYPLRINPWGRHLFEGGIYSSLAGQPFHKSVEKVTHIYTKLVHAAQRSIYWCSRFRHLCNRVDIIYLMGEATLSGKHLPATYYFKLLVVWVLPLQLQRYFVHTSQRHTHVGIKVHDILLYCVGNAYKPRA